MELLLYLKQNLKKKTSLSFKNVYNSISNIILSFAVPIINAFVHNKWVDGNALMITIYSDRMEILSRGTLAPKQTMRRCV